MNKISLIVLVALATMAYVNSYPVNYENLDKELMWRRSMDSDEQMEARENDESEEQNDEEDTPENTDNEEETNEEQPEDEESDEEESSASNDNEVLLDEYGRPNYGKG